MNNALKENTEMIKSFEGDIRQALDTDKIKKDITRMEKEVGSEMPQEYKENLIKNRFRQSLKSNKNDKEFVEFFWNRLKNEIINKIN